MEYRKSVELEIVKELVIMEIDIVFLFFNSL